MGQDVLSTMIISLSQRVFGGQKVRTRVCDDGNNCGGLIYSIRVTKVLEPSIRPH